MKPHVLFLVLTVIALNRSITARTSDGEAWQRYLSRHNIYYHQTKARGVEYIKDMIINPVPGRKVPRELYDVMGTTIFALVLDYFDLKNITTASPYKHELDNAVMCDVNDDLEEVIKRIQYDNVPAGFIKRHREIEENATQTHEFKLNCEISENYDECFCSEKKGLLFCLAKRLRKKIELSGARKKKCKNKVLDELEHLSKPVWNLFTNLEYFGYGDSPLVKQLRKPFEEPGTVLYPILPYPFPNTPEFYCAILDSRVKQSVKQLYASDAFYWYMEESMNRLTGNLTVMCERKDSILENDFGWCYCAYDKGVTFCAFTAIGKYFERKGYLNCDTPSFRHWLRPVIWPTFIGEQFPENVVQELEENARREIKEFIENSTSTTTPSSTTGNSSTSILEAEATPPTVPPVSDSALPFSQFIAGLLISVVILNLGTI